MSCSEESFMHYGSIVPDDGVSLRKLDFFFFFYFRVLYLIFILGNPLRLYYIPKILILSFPAKVFDCLR